MECITVNLIIEPILDSQIPPNCTIFYENINMTVTINPYVFVKDICHVLLHKIGLGHLVNSSEAFIKCPQISCFTSVYCFTNPLINVGSVETWNHEYLTVKICVKGKVEDFSGFEGRNTLYRNLLYLLLKRYPFIRNEENNPYIKEAIDRINDNSIFSLQHPNLYCINDAIEKELVMLNRNFSQIYNRFHPIHDEYNIENSTTTASRESILDSNIDTKMTSPQSVQSLTNSGTFIKYRDICNPIQPSTEEVLYGSSSDEEIKSSSVQNISSRTISTNRPRIKFNPETETPILENRLNDISNRPEEIKVTLHNVRNWFSYRRVKEKRNGIS
ncbi:Hypothetical protein SRAE_1000008300 [Strongyloides ratti]|uniref:Homeobox domain-containing protein n=1 Tax=Strongyloides ratti TaxID=34506 RepID=A0A090L126_STRRB|nr:Hypothetical protein SRAE_1000008300 [Strongyloides ratti]CEF61807.1 Hypothetical protein SRAE_1000008300 [Strongyloides ratti]